MTEANIVSTEKILELHALETIIEQTRDSAAQHWAAWRTIREKRLYEFAGFKDWDSYCKARWQITAHRQNERIIEHETFDKLSGQICPETKIPGSQLRVLSQFKEELRVEIYEAAQQVSQDGKVTAESLEKAATRITQMHEEVAREKKREALAPDPKPTPKAAPKEPEPSRQDRIALRAAKHVIVAAKSIKKALNQTTRWLRKGKRHFATLANAEIGMQTQLDGDVARIEGALDRLLASERKALGSADTVLSAYGELRKNLAANAACTAKIGPLLNETEGSLASYRDQLAEALFEKEECLS